MSSERFRTVWEATAPTEAEAKILTWRSELLADVASIIRDQGLTSDHACAMLGIDSEALSHLLSGKLSKFDLEALICLSERCGQRIALVRSPFAGARVG